MLFKMQNQGNEKSNLQGSDGKDAVPAIPGDPKWASHPEKGLTGALNALAIGTYNDRSRTI